MLWRAVAPTWTAVVLAVLAGSALIGLAARVAIPLPFSPVPITGQTFAVLLVGAALGARLGAAALTAYLVEGLLGLPVFAGGTSAWAPTRIPGVPVILGPTAGYLAGFVAAAFVVGWLAERGWDRRPLTTALAMALGNVAIYLLGLAWLARFVGVEGAFPLGAQPFLVGDLLKLLVAAAVLPAAWRLRRPPR
ncbi:MAG: biotin transporter BioY [Chloroflexota bacterium]|nr:biotin transporter BioY [Chloroflexota bacterium]